MEKYDWESHPKNEKGDYVCLKCNGVGSKMYGDLKIGCASCLGSGLYVDVLRINYNLEKSINKFQEKELAHLRSWIRTNSKCSTCHGIQENTLGGVNCEECGLTGTCPWGS